MEDSGGGGDYSHDSSMGDTGGWSSSGGGISEDTSPSYSFQPTELNNTTESTAYSSSEPAPLPPPPPTVTEQPRSESESSDFASAPQDREQEEEIATDDMRQTWITMDMDENLRPFSKSEESAFSKHFWDALILCCCC